MDVVGLAQQGIANAVATLGTATTPDHVKKLLRASDKVIFSFDGDGAGRRGLARPAGLPAGAARRHRDPLPFPAGRARSDSYVRELGAEAFRACLGEAVALSRFLLDELASRHNMDEAEGRASCLHEAAAAGRDPGMRAARPDRARDGQVGPAHAGRNGPGAGAAAGQTIWRAGGRQGAAGRRLPRPDPRDRIRASWMGATAGHDFHDIPAEESDYTDYGHFHGAHGEPAGAPGGQQGGQRRQEWKPRGDWKGKGDWKRAGHWKGRREDDVGGFEGRRTMPSLAKRLLGLLLAHPELVDSMGDQQLEVIDHGPI